MRKEISFSFVAMCLVTLLSLGDIIGVFSSIIGLFENFSLLNALRIICNMIDVFTPATIAILLYLNRKQDIKSKAYIVLIICGCTQLMGALLSVPTLISLFANPTYPANPAFALIPLFEILSSAILSIFLIVVVISAKSSKVNAAVKVFGCVSIWFGVLLLLLCMIPDIKRNSDLSFFTSINILLLAAGLCYLPKTFYDYKNCGQIDGLGITMLCVLGAVVVFGLLVFRGGMSPGSNNRGNCFNCGGDGWDCENHCSCVWCGGDGDAIWNP